MVYYPGKNNQHSKNKPYLENNNNLRRIDTDQEDVKIKKKQVQKLIGQPIEYFGGINQEQPSPGTKSNDVDTH